MRTAVLDHGYVEIIKAWGEDSEIIESARMSTDGAFKGWGNEEKPGDEKLLKYLYTNGHMTPFEMCGATFEIEAPIFVFREWHRHRTQSYSEMSARYTPLPDTNYVPSVERLMMNNAANKQAGTIGGAVVLTEEEALRFQRGLQAIYQQDEDIYQYSLAMGIPKELARLVLPVGRYSRMRATGNLRNWLQFLTLRCDSHAQWEIRQFANAVAEHLKFFFPRTMKLWEGK